jgi:oligopeptidase B
MKPPYAQKIPVTLSTAGHERIDNYYWLNERDNPKVLEYLEAENAYTKAVMKDTEKLQDELYTEITSRIRQDDRSVPYFKNGYFYYSRYEKGGEYPVYCRKKGSQEAPEEILLDGNRMAEGHSFFRIGDYKVSPGNNLLAYCEDTLGRNLYTIRFKNLETGETLPTQIENAAGSFAWADDNLSLFYCLRNTGTLRSETLMLHRLMSGAADKAVYHEDDETFDITVYRSKSEKLIMLAAYSNSSTEYSFLDAGNPAGSFRLVQAREKDVEYHAAHFRDKFYIVTNYQAKNFRLMETSLHATGKEHWKEVLPHRSDVFLENIDIFNDFMVVSERKDGLVQMFVRPMSGEEGHYISFEEEVYTAESGHNPAFDTEHFRFAYSSLTTPASVYEYNMRTRGKTLLKQQEVVGGYSPGEYIAKRLFAVAKDGKKVPISVVHRKDTVLDGKTPLLLYGYGSYGITADPCFSMPRISLLDRGFIFAVAHIRGGQYLGREWYEDGKLLNKRNTFTDYIACAEYLIEQKYAGRGQLFGMGGSAGGLLMGAAANMSSALFNGIIAAVPFVDVVTTMSDKSIPLTAGEYDEWGNPEDETCYRYMMSYSPYDNVRAQEYPNMLITAGLHDSQVQYWEPAKWTAKLRELKTDGNLLLLHTNMDAGHGGASGRFETCRETALEYAFLLKCAGLINKQPSNHQSKIKNTD